MVTRIGRSSLFPIDLSEMKTKYMESIQQRSQVSWARKRKGEIQDR